MSDSMKSLDPGDRMDKRIPVARLRRTILLLSCLPFAALAQMESMEHGQMKGMDHGQMEMGAMQGGSAPADARDPDAYAGDLAPGMSMAMDDNTIHAQLLLDRLEYTYDNESDGMALDAQAWVGTDLNKLWLKAETERSEGRWGETRAEALWDHAISPYWGLQGGVRSDSGGGGPSRTWAAFGVQGLAPYWFELQATAYVGESGRTAFRLEAEYDLLLTQQLVLQPTAEINVHGKNDPERGIGSGLSDIEAGLRLRYDITRKVSPYVGVSWNRKFGTTADYARAAGEDASAIEFVAGIKLWF